MIIHGDCLDAFRDVRGLASIVSDPPGGGSFMGLAFDRAHGGRDGWIAAMAPRFKVAREATERTPERHRLELVNAAALRAEEKRQEEAAARGQLDWTRGL